MNCMVSGIGAAWRVLQIDLDGDICIVEPQEIWLSFTQIKMSQFGGLVSSVFSEFFYCRKIQICVVETSYTATENQQWWSCMYCTT